MQSKESDLTSFILRLVRVFVGRTVIGFVIHCLVSIRPPDKSMQLKIICVILCQNICCGDSKESHRWCGSSKHPEHMFKLMANKTRMRSRWGAIANPHAKVFDSPAPPSPTLGAWPQQQNKNSVQYVFYLLLVRTHTKFSIKSLKLTW